MVYSDFEDSNQALKVVWRVAAIYLTYAIVIFGSLSVLAFSGWHFYKIYDR